MVFQKGTGAGFAPSTSLFPASHSNDCNTVIIIHHLVLVQ
jgi:hypothetical protein